MIPLTLDGLAAVLRATTVGPSSAALADTRITDVMTDSRVPAEGPAVFFALPTERADGHDHVAAAGRAGAVVAVVSRPTGAEGPVELVVDDPWAAIAALARHVRASVDPRVVAITGSYGKTTVKDLSAAALAPRHRVTASRGSFNNELGVPLTMLGVAPGCDVLVAEAGARNAGDLATLGELLAPDVSVVTAVGPVHLETFGDEDGVAAEKSRLVRALGASGTAVLNLDDARVAAMAALAPHVVGVGITSDGAEVTVEQLRTDDAGRARGVVRTPWGSAPLALPVPGTHHVTNALLALAVAGVEGVPPDEASAALTQARTSPSRSALHVVAGVRVLDDAYNASPPTVRAALRTLATLPCEGRRWAVLGVMAELGPRAEELHREVGRACGGVVDELVVVGPAAAGIAEGAAEAVPAPRVHTVADHAAAAELVVDGVRSGDAVLFKASRVATLDLAAAHVLAALGQEHAA